MCDFEHTLLLSSGGLGSGKVLSGIPFDPSLFFPNHHFRMLLLMRLCMVSLNWYSEHDDGNDDKPHHIGHFTVMPREIDVAARRPCRYDHAGWQPKVA